MENPFNITGKKDRDGKEKEFDSFLELNLEVDTRNKERILKETNIRIKMRNEVRNRKKELTKEALKLWGDQMGIIEVSARLLKKIKSYDPIYPYVVINVPNYPGITDFIEKIVLLPLIENNTVSLVGFKPVPDGTNTSIALYQKTQLQHA